MPDTVGDTRFPRGQVLPSQPPRHWVQQKDRYLRLLLAGDIEQITGRRLVVYFSDRSSEYGGISDDDVVDLCDALNDARGAPVDLLIETNGGLVDAADSLVSMITQTAPDLRVVIPNAAKSCGTLVALCAREIVMGAPSELGPIEPQLGGAPTTLLMDAKFEKTDFVSHWLGSQAYRHMEQIAKRLLTDVVLKGQPDKIDQTLKALVSRDQYHSHGSVINHRDAQKLGLNVTYLPPSDVLWQRIWLLFCMYAEDCRIRGLSKIFESRDFTRQRTPPPASEASVRKPPENL